VQLLNYDDPALPPNQFHTVPALMKALVDAAGSEVKLGVLEEDGGYHGAYVVVALLLDGVLA
jgi:hypothetical protein